MRLARRGHDALEGSPAPKLRVIAIAFLGALGFSCGGSSPTDLDATCRNYPRAFEENGLSFTCELDQGAEVTLVCAAGASTRRWEYRSLADFVSEVAIPNRPRVTSRTTTGGVLLGSFTSTIRSYEYDSGGRVMRRRRTSSGIQGTFVLDDTRYVEWDGRGRPTRGEIESGSLSDSVTLVYDDARLRVDTSTGEHVSIDANGNLLEEVEVFGLGPDPFRSERLYGAIVTARVCLP